jgi:hypothetical protein
VLRRRTTTRSEPPPAVVRPFISAKNNGPVTGTGARAHESYSLGVSSWVRRRRTTARGSVPLLLHRKKQTTQSLAWGPGPASHTPWASVPGCGEGELPLAPVLCRLGAIAEDIGGDFLNRCSSNEAPRARPSETIMRGGRGSVSRGDRRGSWCDRRRAGSDYVSKRMKAACQSPTKLWPHLQARILPRGGPGGHCRYPETGVPLTTV